MPFQRKIFYDTIRESIYGGKLSSDQVGGFETLLDAWEADYTNQDDRLLAYCLATAHHETSATLQPIEEYGSDARAERLYGPKGKNPARAKRMGNTKVGDGARYKGRGYVQLTWKKNYLRAGNVLGADLVERPFLALRSDYAARILFQGCLKGWFTGRRLSDYIAGAETDYVNARQVVNGTDKARKIAAYAVEFEAALSDARHAPAPDASPPPKPTPKPRKTGIVAAILAILEALTGGRKK